MHLIHLFNKTIWINCVIYSFVCYKRHPSLRVAYIDERDETIGGKQEKVFYSVLIKGGENRDEVLVLNSFLKNSSELVEWL